MKKNFGATWLMSAVVVALAGYTLYDYKNAQREATYAEGERPAFDLKGDNIDTIIITRPEESIEMHQQDGVWKMTKPVEDQADDAGILAFLYTLTTQRVREFHPEGEKQGPVDWAKYGLDKPLAIFELRAGKQTESLALSTKNAFDGSFYLRRGDDLLMGDVGFAQLKDRPAALFRAKEIYRNKAPITSAEITLDNDGQKANYKITKKDNVWSLDPKPKFALDYAQLDSWLDKLREFKAGEIAKDGFNPEDKDTFLLTKPSLKIKINNTWEATFGQDRDGEVFVYTNQRPTLYKSNAQAITHLRVGEDFFRDGRKPFEFPVEQAASIEIKTAKFKHTFKKQDSNWLSAEGKEIDQDKLIEFVSIVHGLEAHEYVNEVQTGIVDPQVIVKNDKGEPIFQLSWGKDYKAQMAYNNHATLVYARTNLEKETFGLPKAKIMALENPALLKEVKK